MLFDFYYFFSSWNWIIPQIFKQKSLLIVKMFVFYIKKLYWFIRKFKLLGESCGLIFWILTKTENMFIFYSNYQSTKGRELENNPACALTFFWPELERQVRIEGTAERIDDERSGRYFQSRPRGSQIGAWTSPQSSIIESREILEQRARQIEKRFEGVEALPKPNQWGGYAVDPILIEFWQGRPNRLHDRIQFSKIDNTWKIHRLAPWS